MERRSTPGRRVHRSRLAHRSRRSREANSRNVPSRRRLPSRGRETSSRDDERRRRLPSRDRDESPRAEDHERCLPSRDRDESPRAEDHECRAPSRGRSVHTRAEERRRRGTSRDSDISSRDEQLGLHLHGRGGGNLRGGKGRPFRGSGKNYRGARRYSSSRGRRDMNQRGGWGYESSRGRRDHAPSRDSSSHTPSRSSSNHALSGDSRIHVSSLGSSSRELCRGSTNHESRRGTNFMISNGAHGHMPTHVNGVFNHRGSHRPTRGPGRGGIGKPQLMYNHHHNPPKRQYSNTRKSLSPSGHRTLSQQEEERRSRIPPLIHHKLSTHSGYRSRSRSPHRSPGHQSQADMHKSFPQRGLANVERRMVINLENSLNERRRSSKWSPTSTFMQRPQDTLYPNHESTYNSHHGDSRTSRSSNVEVESTSQLHDHAVSNNSLIEGMSRSDSSHYGAMAMSTSSNWEGEKDSHPGEKSNQSQADDSHGSDTPNYGESSRYWNQDERVPRPRNNSSNSSRSNIPVSDYTHSHSKNKRRSSSQAGRNHETPNTTTGCEGNSMNGSSASMEEEDWEKDTQYFDQKTAELPETLENSIPLQLKTAQLPNPVQNTVPSDQETKASDAENNNESDQKQKETQANVKSFFQTMHPVIYPHQSQLSNPSNNNELSQMQQAQDINQNMALSNPQQPAPLNIKENYQRDLAKLQSYYQSLGYVSPPPQHLNPPMNQNPCNTQSEQKHMPDPRLDPTRKFKLAVRSRFIEIDPKTLRPYNKKTNNENDDSGLAGAATTGVHDQQNNNSVGTTSTPSTEDLEAKQLAAALNWANNGQLQPNYDGMCNQFAFNGQGATNSSSSATYENCNQPAGDSRIQRHKPSSTIVRESDAEENFNQGELGVSRSNTEDSPVLHGLLTQGGGEKTEVPQGHQVPITARKHAESNTRRMRGTDLESDSGNTPTYSQSGSQTPRTSFNMPLTPRTPFDAQYVPKTPQNPYYIHRTPSTPGDKDWTPSTQGTPHYAGVTPRTPAEPHPSSCNNRIDDIRATGTPNGYSFGTVEGSATPSTSRGERCTYALGRVQLSQPSSSEGAPRRPATIQSIGSSNDANLNAVRDSVRAIVLRVAEENGTAETDFTDTTTVNFTPMESLNMFNLAKLTVGDPRLQKVSNQPTSFHSFKKPFCKELDSNYPIPPLPSIDEIRSVAEYQVPYDCKKARMRYQSRFSREVPQRKIFKRIPLTMSNPQIKSRYSNLVRNQGLAAVKDILTIDEEELKRGIHFSEVIERNKKINLRQSLHLQCLERYGSDRMMKLMVHVDTHVCDRKNLDMIDQYETMLRMFPR